MGQPYSKSIDIWSLGVTLFEMMMLGHAFGGPDVREILRNIVHARHAEIVGEWSDDLTRRKVKNGSDWTPARCLCMYGWVGAARQEMTATLERLRHTERRSLLARRRGAACFTAAVLPEVPVLILKRIPPKAQKRKKRNYRAFAGCVFNANSNELHLLTVRAPRLPDAWRRVSWSRTREGGEE